MEYGKPIRVFLANLLRHGIALRADNGTLRIGGPGRANLSKVYREEIIRRAPQLLELLSPPVPEPLQPYTGRLISVADAEAAQEIANQMKTPITLTPANGGWLMLIRRF